MDFIMPPHLNNPQGEKRKIGFELEFTGLEFEETARLIIEVFGGKHTEVKKYIHKVENSEFGDFRIELDSRILKYRPYEKHLKDIGIDLESINLSEQLEDILSAIASTWVPQEVGLPPVPIDQMTKIEQLRKLLHKKKAMGTRGSLIYAFGLHINPEIPDDSIQSVLNHLRAFLLLEPWISLRSEIDITRERLTAYINDFSFEYQRKVLNTAYAPNQDAFIRDYLRFNPTRNRPLDLLPLLSYLKGEKLTGIKDKHEKLVSARPAYHYRLPNCLIDDPNWSIAAEWNYWVEVEKLAADEDKLQQWSREMMILSANELFNWKKKWAREVEKKRGGKS